MTFGAAGQKPLPIADRPNELRRLAALWQFWAFSLAPFLSAATLVVAFVPAAFLAWPKYGRDIAPVGSVLSITLHILGKLGLHRVKRLNNTEPLRTSTIIDVKV